MNISDVLHELVESHPWGKDTQTAQLGRTLAHEVVDAFDTVTAWPHVEPPAPQVDAGTQSMIDQAVAAALAAQQADVNNAAIAKAVAAALASQQAAASGVEAEVAPAVPSAAVIPPPAAVPDPSVPA